MLKSCRQLPRSLAILVLASLAMGSGCFRSAPERVPLQGTVNVSGKPLAVGTITFLPSGKTTGPASSTTVTQGHYALTLSNGPRPGTYSVTVASDQSPSEDDASAEPPTKITSKSEFKTTDRPSLTETLESTPMTWQQRNTRIENDTKQLDFEF